MLKEALVWLMSLCFASSNEPETYIPSTFVPEGVTLNSLERYQQQPSFFRGIFTTSRITDFIAYLNRVIASTLDADNASLFIADDCTGARAIIDLGSQDDPLWGHHVADLEMRKTPEYEALLGVQDVTLTQRDAIDFFEDYHYCITPIMDGEAASTAAALQALRKMRVDQRSERKFEEQDYRQQAEGMESIDFAADGDTSRVDSFTFTVSPFLDTQKRALQVRMIYKTGGNKQVNVKMRIVALDKIEQEVQQEIEDRVMDGLDFVDMAVSVGSFQNRNGLR